MELINDLTCPVCLELLSRPVVLPCSHVLCQRPCAETIFEVSCVRCPVCREKCGTEASFPNLPRVLAIENIIEKVRAWQKQAEANHTNTPTSDSLQSTMCESSDACSPLTFLNNSWVSPMNEFSVKEEGLESINQNDNTTHIPSQECNNNENTTYPSASMSRIVSYCDVSEESGVSAVSVGSSSQKQMVDLASYIDPVRRKGFNASHEYSDSQAGKAYFDALMKVTALFANARENFLKFLPFILLSFHALPRFFLSLLSLLLFPRVHEQLWKLSETQRQLLDTVTSYRKCAQAKWPINTTTLSTMRIYVLIEGLSHSTNYYFSACAVNRTGRSPSSDYVMCRTLNQHGCGVPVPVIIKSSCSTSATSITVMCPCPRMGTRFQDISYFLLFRKRGSDFVWQGEEMREAKEHQVGNLETGTCYQFVVLACDSRGESQTSEKITLTTLDVGEKECNRVVALVC
ncbi:unnamed protein product [Candidula unifasciata]|uniref:RING-type domain-containing protein n=1 Tax=Candidula unifasciata TaxID=100452 RepID=A0A8S4A1Z6_9EUPU|nr:unnamed protein product [Candidula unifasciata]